jgi:hypothetical protein
MAPTKDRINEEGTSPMAIAPGTAAHAAVQLASLPPEAKLQDLAAIVQETLDTALAETEQHRQKLVALIRAIVSRPEMFANEPSARASVDRFLEESEARWGRAAAGRPKE